MNIASSGRSLFINSCKRDPLALGDVQDQDLIAYVTLTSPIVFSKSHVRSFDDSNQPLIRTLS
jgi:hypothetical protein